MTRGWRAIRTLARLASLPLAAALYFRARRPRPVPFDWRDKTVLITGGSRGLGLILARQVIEAGGRVAICARQPVELERARADLIARGGTVLAMLCDVSQPDQVVEMVRLVNEFLGPVDVLINNAGIITVGPLESMTLDDFAETMGVHFWGPLQTTMAVLPGMLERHAGRIVNIASIGGKLAMPHLLPYDASKFALTGLSQGMRAELAKDGIVVTTVCPGLMRTGSPLNAYFKSQHRAEYTWFSIADSLPFLSMDANRAARRILRACQRGRAEVMLSAPARLAVAFHGLFPGLTADLLAAVNRLLPTYSGIGPERLPGKESRSPLSPSLLTILSDQAAVKNNEVA